MSVSTLTTAWLAFIAYYLVFRFFGKQDNKSVQRILLISSFLISVTCICLLIVDIAENSFNRNSAVLILNIIVWLLIFDHHLQRYDID